MNLRIVALSDTHGTHRRTHVPEGDVLVHAGDFTAGGKDIAEILDFSNWFVAQPHTVKIVVCGNHDELFDKAHGIGRAILHPDIIYLEHEPFRTHGVNFFGSPYTPVFNRWAFERERGWDIHRLWKMIPDDTDVLITHGPPYGILDIFQGDHIGCEALREEVDRRRGIRHHIFGHVHTGHGEANNSSTHSHNVATTDLLPVICPGEEEPRMEYIPRRPAVVIDMEVRQ